MRVVVTDGPHHTTYHHVSMAIRLEYDMMGSRLRSIGNTTIDYDMFGSRVQRIGRFTVSHDLAGSRARSVESDDGQPMTDEETIHIFLVLGLAAHTL